MVAIVIINHNYGEFLRFAIDSALSQRVSASEVVVVDDGSEDDSRAIIASYGDRIVGIFKAAGGHVSAVNAGYAAIVSDLCIFLDADDLLYPDCVETILATWSPGDVKLQYRLDTIDRIGVSQNMPFPYFPPDLGPEEVRSQSFRYGVYPWTVSSGNVYARSFLDNLMPIDATEIYRSPDGYLNKMAPLFGNVRSTNVILGAYRVHGSNAWAQDSDKLRIEPILRWLKFEQVLQRRFQNEAARRGLKVVQEGRIRTLQQAEYQLLARRFAPAPRPGYDRNALALFLASAQTAVVAPNTSLPGRAVWISWLFTLAFLPKVVVQPIFSAARGQGGRGLISRLLLMLSRGSAK